MHDENSWLLTFEEREIPDEDGYAPARSDSMAASVVRQ
jgi:hypothetical protein